ncbi:MAG: hypothetical protein RPS47_00120 [Colwellia sp.]|jgi:hypothetical protein
MKNDTELLKEQPLKAIWQKPELESCLLEHTQAAPGSGTDGGITST